MKLQFKDQKKRDVEKFLKEHGYEPIRSESHVVWKKNEHTIVIPHGKIIKAGVVNQINKKIERAENESCIQRRYNKPC